MADNKLTDAAIPALLGVDTAANDRYLVVDVSDATRDPAGSPKYQTRDELAVALRPSALYDKTTGAKAVEADNGMVLIQPGVDFHSHGDLVLDGPNINGSVQPTWVDPDAPEFTAGWFGFFYGAAASVDAFDFEIGFGPKTTHAFGVTASDVTSQARIVAQTSQTDPALAVFGAGWDGSQAGVFTVAPDGAVIAKSLLALGGLWPLGSDDDLGGEQFPTLADPRSATWDERGWALVHWGDPNGEFGNTGGFEILASSGPNAGRHATLDIAGWNTGAYFSVYTDGNDGVFLGIDRNISRAQLQVFKHDSQTDPAIITNGFIEVYEWSGDPGAAPATSARLYTKNVGGKVGLYVQFPTGAVQQIKVEA